MYLKRVLHRCPRSYAFVVSRPSPTHRPHSLVRADGSEITRELLDKLELNFSDSESDSISEKSTEARGDKGNGDVQVGEREVSGSTNVGQNKDFENLADQNLADPSLVRAAFSTHSNDSGSSFDPLFDIATDSVVDMIPDHSYTDVSDDGDLSSMKLSDSDAFLVATFQKKLSQLCSSPDSDVSIKQIQENSALEGISTTVETKVEEFPDRGAIVDSLNAQSKTVSISLDLQDKVLDAQNDVLKTYPDQEKVTPLYTKIHNAETDSNLVQSETEQATLPAKITLQEESINKAEYSESQEISLSDKTSIKQSQINEPVRPDNIAQKQSKHMESSISTKEKPSASRKKRRHLEEEVFVFEQQNDIPQSTIKYTIADILKCEVKMPVPLQTEINFLKKRINVNVQRFYSELNRLALDNATVVLFNIKNLKVFKSDLPSLVSFFVEKVFYEPVFHKLYLYLLNNLRDWYYVGEVADKEAAWQSRLEEVHQHNAMLLNNSEAVERLNDSQIGNDRSNTSTVPEDGKFMLIQDDPRVMWSDFYAMVMDECTSVLRNFEVWAFDVQFPKFKLRVSELKATGMSIEECLEAVVHNKRVNIFKDGNTMVDLNNIESQTQHPPSQLTFEEESIVDEFKYNMQVDYNKRKDKVRNTLQFINRMFVNKLITKKMYREIVMNIIKKKNDQESIELILDICNDCLLEISSSKKLTTAILARLKDNSQCESFIKYYSRNMVKKIEKVLKNEETIEESKLKDNRTRITHPKNETLNIENKHSRTDPKNDYRSDNKYNRYEVKHDHRYDNKHNRSDSNRSFNRFDNRSDHKFTDNKLTESKLYDHKFSDNKFNDIKEPTRFDKQPDNKNENRLSIKGTRDNTNNTFDVEEIERKKQEAMMKKHLQSKESSIPYSRGSAYQQKDSQKKEVITGRVTNRINERTIINQTPHTDRNIFISTSRTATNKNSTNNRDQSILINKKGDMPCLDNPTPDSSRINSKNNSQNKNILYGKSYENGKILNGEHFEYYIKNRDKILKERERKNIHDIEEERERKNASDAENIEENTFNNTNSKHS